MSIAPHPEGAVLTVRAQPGARQNALRGWQDGALKIAVTQIAERGKANQALESVLVAALGLRRSQVALLSGPASRQKQFLIRDVSPAELQLRIERALMDDR